MHTEKEYRKNLLRCRSNSPDGKRSERRTDGRPGRVCGFVPHGRWDSPWSVLQDVHLSRAHTKQKSFPPYLFIRQFEITSKLNYSPPVTSLPSSRLVSIFSLPPWKRRKTTKKNRRSRKWSGNSIHYFVCFISPLFRIVIDFNSSYISDWKVVASISSRFTTSTSNNKSDLRGRGLATFTRGRLPALTTVWWCAGMRSWLADVFVSIQTRRGDYLPDQKNSRKIFERRTTEWWRAEEALKLFRK